jgi:hypothetical protein
MTKTKERSQAEQSTNSTLKAPPEQMQAPPGNVDAKFQILDAFF